MLKLHVLQGCVSSKSKKTVSVFNGVVESLFNITVYLRIKDCSGMNIQFNKFTHGYIYFVFRYQLGYQYLKVAFE